MATALENAKTNSGLRREEAGLEVRFQKRLTESFHLDLEFRVPTGITILFGASGAGKTTLLDLIAGLKTPDRGHIRVGERVLFDSENRINVSIRKREIGYVFQDLALFPHLTVDDNVGYGLQAVEAHHRRSQVEQALASLGILPLRSRRPAQLSGGERQRVALARALVTRPSLLLLDEPLAALDVPVRMKIAEDLRHTIQNLPIPVLYVTHSRDEVFALGERLLVLEQGKLIAQGTPHAVLSAPRAETVAQLAGFENIFDAEVRSVHEERGTMTCRISNARTEAMPVELETPLVRAQPGTRLKVGISAGDVLLATSAPVGLSARNILPGRLISLDERDTIIVARADCGIELAVHLTLGARDSLGLAPGRQVWVIFKTHSCHLLAEDPAG
jgi:molybdate transport system ATP-binding protein